MRKPNVVGAVCVICAKDVIFDEALGMTLFPAKDTKSYQQWWAHPQCMKVMFAPEMLDHMRDELAEMFDE